jgi:hypothetical protein
VPGRVVSDAARKVMILEVDDGTAILGYAGLGATPKGTEPADWMSAVLRGRKLPLEQSLGVLAMVAQKQLPKHMVRLPSKIMPAHVVIAPAFVEEEPRLYTLELRLSDDRLSFDFQFRRHVSAPGSSRPPRTAAGGSGAAHVNRDKLRGVYRLIRANDRGRVSEQTVADSLASLNHEVHRAVADASVGPRCIVSWRFRKGGVHQGGGGHYGYTGTTRDPQTPDVPTIAGGIDVSALVGMLMPHATKMFEDMKVGEENRGMDEDALNADLALLPDWPDEELR